MPVIRGALVLLVLAGSVRADGVSPPPPNWAAPGSIGSTTPAAGAFTSLTVSLGGTILTSDSATGDVRMFTDNAGIASLQISRSAISNKSGRVLFRTGTTTRWEVGLNQSVGNGTDTFSIYNTTSAQSVLQATDVASNLPLTTLRGQSITLVTQSIAGGGLRNGSTRNIIRTTNAAPADCAGATLNLTVAQFVDGGIFTCATAQTVNFPTWQGSSGIVQSMPGPPAVGDVVDVWGVATAANAITLGFGTGGTNGSGGATVPASITRHIICRITSITANSETATCY